MKKTVVLWAVLSITIPNVVVNRSTTAFCGTYGYQPVVNGALNPETPLQFTQRMISNFMKQIIISYETVKTQQSAGDSQRQQSTVDMSGIQ